MPANENQERSGFSELLAELSDSDVVIEISSSETGRQTLESGPVRRLQDAVEASYKALAGPVDVQLQTVAVLDEVAKHSLSVWLRVHRAGDGALADSSDASLLKFLARGTLAIIAWMDGSPTLQLADLQQAIRVLAWGTSITTTAQPALPSSSDLVDAVAAWQKAKSSLNASDSVRIITNNGSAKLDLTKTIEEPRALLQSRKLVIHSADLIFVVEMPDYQGSGQWLLKHGGTRTTAAAEPGTLLDKFYRRELDIRPGDAIRCKVDIETSYGPDHEVLAERYRIVDIVEVLPPTRGEAVAATPRADMEPHRLHAPELEEAAS
jgi:flagellar hook-basal body complex protein FliE